MEEEKSLDLSIDSTTESLLNLKYSSILAPSPNASTIVPKTTNATTKTAVLNSTTVSSTAIASAAPPETPILKAVLNNVTPATVPM